VILVSASIFPTNVVVVPSVAELPIFQKTQAPDAPRIRTTRELLPVVRLLPVWKM
jgi:hypothetical protein